jgi:predicted DNA-binding transcriptional regulator AlpA
VTPTLVGLRALASAPPAGSSELEPLLTAAEVARILGVRPKRVYELGIPAVRLSEKTLRWRRSAVQVWLEQRTEGGTA